MKNILFKLVYIVTAAVVLVEGIIGIKNELFTDIADLPKGKKLYSIAAPSGDRAMNIYVVSNNLGDAIRGEIVTDKETYNIFWQTGIDNVNAYWADDKNVIINNVAINSDDTFGYDCRRGISLFDEGTLEQNFVNPEGQLQDE